MKILAVGGGSGGHVTPVVAVLKVLKGNDPEVDIRFWCDRKFFKHAVSIVHHYDKSIPVQAIASGKLRRYNNIPFWKQVFHPGILFPNVRDMFLVLLGFIQSFVKLVLWRPDVVFTKGGFVCLPVGIAARVLHIPLVVHDSDAHPGLTNRILSRWATAIGTGAPLEYYRYPASRTQYVGIPVDESCRPLTLQGQKKAKEELGFDPSRPLVVVTGGGLGAMRINDAVVIGLSELLKTTSVMLVSGSTQYDALKAITPQQDERFQLHAFVTPIIPALQAADLVVARAGATTLLELAALAKPTIVIPNGQLTGGHQLKNAKVYADREAIAIIPEGELEDPSRITSEVQRLLMNVDALKKLSKNIHSFAKPEAANEMARMIMDASK